MSSQTAPVGPPWPPPESIGQPTSPSSPYSSVLLIKFPLSPVEVYHGLPAGLYPALFGPLRL